MPRLQGRITGIVLGGYKHNVYEFLKHDVGTVDKGMFMEALESAVCHLHDMRFAYNDITPLNIMVGEDRLPVLVGFGSCRMLAEAMSASRGTGGWGDEGDDDAVSSARRNMFGLERMREWSESPTFNM